MKTKNENPEISQEVVKKLIKTVKRGLTSGMGDPTPGKMCVEAAVCYAYGLEHDDEPPCVGKAVRNFKIELNDSDWSSKQARGRGMIELSIAQLNSNVISQSRFAKKLLLAAINTTLADMATKSSHKLAQRFRKAKTLTGMTEAIERFNNEYKDQTKGNFIEYLYRGTKASNPSIMAEKVAEAYKSLPAKKQDEHLNSVAQLCLKVLKDLKSPGCEYLFWHLSLTSFTAISPQKSGLNGTVARISNQHYSRELFLFKIGPSF